MTTFLLDLNQALRGLLKAPAFAATALATLTLGIGANTAMFSAIRGFLFKPLPFREPAGLVALWEARPSRGVDRAGLSAPNFFDWRDRAGRSFEGMSITSSRSMDLAGIGEPERIEGLRVSPAFFDLLGARPLLGSAFAPDMEQSGKDHVAILSHGLWQRRFGSDAWVVGRSVTLNGEPYTILGVLPQGFRYPADSAQDLYLPYTRPANGDNRGSHSLRAFGRLRAGVSIDAAKSELNAIAAELARTYPGTNEGFTAGAGGLRADLLGDGSKPLLLLMGAAGLLLLIACTNVANLFLARALAREREAAIRASLGASRRHLFSRFLAEGLLIGAGGGLLGLWMASALVKILPAILPNTGDLNQVQRLALDPWALAFTLALSLVVSLAFGLAPAWQMRESRLNLSLREGVKGSAASGRLRSALVLGEVALATLLLLSAGLLLRGFLRILNTPPGFDAKGVLAFGLDLPRVRYAEEAHQEAFRAELERRLSQLPGVTSAGAAEMAPLSGRNSTTSAHIGPTALPVNKWDLDLSVNCVSPGFFSALRIPVLQGRGFQPGDNAQGTRVMVVNQALARALFPGGNALGQRMLVGYDGDTTPARTLWEIVGVVGDVRHWSLERDPAPTYFLPLSQMPASRLAYFVRGQGSFAALQGAIREQVRALDAGLALHAFEPFEAQVRRSLGDRRQALALLTLFAGLGLALAGLGIYGVMAYSVTQRTKEIGIRMALGAQIREVLGLVMGHGLRLTLWGAGLGLLSALLTGRLIASQMAGIGVLDPLTCLGVAALLCAVALLACLAPALRAARVNPVIALRAE